MSLLGGLGAALGGLLGFAGQESANDAQMSMLERQIEWQKEVLQNKVQWNVEDMKAAGLNPVLSVMGSGGASGSAPSASAPQVGNSLSAAMSSALQFAGIANSFNEQANRTIATKSSANAQDAAAVEKMMQAFESLNRMESGYWPGMTQQAISSAKAHNAEVMRVGIYEKQVSQWINESIARQQQYQSDVDRLGAQIALLKKQTQTEDVRRQLLRAETSYNDAMASLSKQQKETEFYRGLEIKARGDLLHLEAPRALADAEFYSSSFGNFMRGVGNSVGAIGRLLGGY